MRSVLVYADYGSATVDVLVNRLKSYGIQVALTDSAGICRGDLSVKEVDALFIGGGAATPYKQKLGENGMNAIRDYVRQGGSYIGICAGAYFACEKIKFEQDVPELSITQTGVGLLAATAIGTLRKEFDLLPYERTSRSATVVDLKGEISGKAYYHGGCYFETNTARIVSSYALSSPKPAIIVNDFGKGRVLATGVHLEEDVLSLKSAFRSFSSDAENAMKNINILEKSEKTDLLKNALLLGNMMSF